MGVCIDDLMAMAETQEWRARDAAWWRGLTRKRRGEMAEAAFLHKASRLGFGVSKPWGDSEPYDLIVDGGTKLWRVQVKSAYRAGAYGGYCLHAHGNEHKKVYSLKEIDVIGGLHCSARLVVRGARLGVPEHQVDETVSVQPAAEIEIPGIPGGLAVAGGNASIGPVGLAIVRQRTRRRGRYSSGGSVVRRFCSIPPIARQCYGKTLGERGSFHTGNTAENSAGIRV